MKHDTSTFLFLNKLKHNNISVLHVENKEYIKLALKYKLHKSVVGRKNNNYVLSI